MPTVLPAAIPAWRDDVLAQADAVARLYLSAAALGQPATREHKELIEGVIAADYDGRTVVELLQNAHDALPSVHAGGGRVTFRLRPDEGPHGVLYVANDGKPLDAAGFRALCRVALSAKRPHEGIGNKGVGFKSVLQLADGVEVYSRATDGDCFDGYCFRFAQPGDFDDLAARVAPGRVGFADELRREVAALKVPVPVTAEPDAVGEFARSGYATVVRLVLRSARARARAAAQLDELADRQPPFTLFLDRLSALVVDHGGVRVLARRSRERGDSVGAAGEAPCAHAPAPACLTVHDVTLGGEEYTVLTRRVAEADMRAAIGRSRAEGRVGPAWESWRGDARVSVALPVRGIAAGRLYAALPMGPAAAAPLHAYVDAPFAVRLDRRDLHTTVPLNDFLLGETAALCAEALRAVAHGTLTLGAGQVVDLASWRRPALTRLVRACAAAGEPLADLPFLPGRERISLRDGVLWQSPGRAFRAAAVAGLGVDGLIDLGADDAGGDRAQRLRTLAGDLGTSLDPEAAVQAAWAERYVLEALPPAGTAGWAQAWRQLLDDLMRVFPDLSVLAGRRILPSAPDGVPVAPGGAVTVFTLPDVPAMPPAAPASVAAHIAFVHPALRADTPALAALARHGLLQPYATDRVLALLARLSTPGREEVCLRFAHALWQREPHDPAFRTHGAALRVAAVGGWCRADEAVFGTGWGSHDAETAAALDRLLAPGRSAPRPASLDVLAARVLPAPAVRDPHLPAWRTFLETVGVAHGLRPSRIPAAEVCLTGRDVASPPPELSVLEGVLPPSTRRMWLATAARRPRHAVAPRFTTVDYRAATDLAVLPGQDDHDALGPDARRAFAELVLRGLDEWPDEAFAFAFTRPNDPRRPHWPTPLAAFLTTAAWVPQTVPGRPRDVAYAAPAAAWWTRAPDAPAQVPVQPRDLAVGPRALSRLADLGLRFWDAPESAADRLHELTRAVAATPNASAHTLRAAYEGAWADLVATTRTLPGQPAPQVVASRAGRLTVVPLGPDAESVYVPVPRGIARERLLRAAPVLMLPLRDRGVAERVYTLLTASGARALRRTTDARVDIDVDGEPPADAPAMPLLALSGAWLTACVVACLEFSDTPGLRLMPRQSTRAVRRLDRALVTVAAEVTTRIDGHVVDEGDSRARSFVWDPGRPEPPRVVVTGLRDRSQWSILRAASRGIAELVGVPPLADTLRLAFIDLEAACTPPAQPTTADIATAVGVPVAELRDLLAERAADHPDRGRLTAALACIDVDLAREFAAAPLATTPDVRTWLAARVRAHDPDELLALAARGDTADVVTGLGLALARANSGLRALGLPPLHNTAGHERAFAAYLQRERARLQDRVRDAFAPRHAAGAPLDAYLRLRELPGLAADPTWLDTHWDLPTDLLDAHADTWLATHLPVAVPGPARRPVADLRAANRRTVVRVLPGLRHVVDAWLRRNPGAPGAFPGPEEAADGMTRAGILDFKALTPLDIVRWLSAQGHWPRGMPLTLRRDRLGLTARETRDVAGLPRPARAAAPPGTVSFRGRAYTAARADLAALATAVRASVTPSQLAVPPQPFAVLAAPVVPAARAPRTPGPAVDPDRRTPPAAPATDAIGLAGETVAGEWLRAHYGVAPEESWMSAYRDVVFGDGRGDDGLGYDFRVLHGERTLLFEVKTTAGAETEFSLGETEVRRAQGLGVGEEYHVLFISEVFDPDRRRLACLPNPLAPGGLSRYRVTAQSMRLRFTLA